MIKNTESISATVLLKRCGKGSVSIVIGPYAYLVTEIEELNSGSVAVTIDTGSTHILQPTDRVQVKVA